MTRLTARAGTPWIDPLADELADIERVVRSIDASTFEPLRGVLEVMFARGGKRVRPAVVVAACSLGRPSPEAVTMLGAAVETLHAATLVHDDLVDSSTVRRGLPTLNARWTAGATVLAGDWLFARAAHFAAATGNVRVMSIFARTLQTLTDGELRQLFGRRAAPDRHEYEARIYAKTGSLFEAAAEMGAVLAMQNERIIRALAEYGRELGIAFQIVDDILDFTGDAGRLGKPVGSDLRSGTVTLPLIEHLERRGETLADGAVPEGDEAEQLVLAVAADRTALAAAQAAAREHAQAARVALHILPAGPAREHLERIAVSAVDRDV